MKIVNILLTIIFALFALAQYNDSDSWHWVMIYLYIAVVSFFAFKGAYNRGILLIGMLVIFGWMVLLWSGFYDWIQNGMPSITEEMSASDPYIEIVREFLGLALAFITLIFHYFSANRIE